MSERDDNDDLNSRTSVTTPPASEVYATIRKYEGKIAEALARDFGKLGVDGNTNRTTIADVEIVAIEHHAGPMIELVQKCTRCGEVIEDYRNCAFAPGDSPGLGFAEGPVTRAGRATFTGTLDGAQKCGQREA